MACECGAADLTDAEELDVHVEDFVGLLGDAFHYGFVVR